MSGATFATLSTLDTKLARKGHHALTPWWRDTLEEFYAHPSARTLVARVGRGGAKSHTSVRVSLNETLFGDWKIPPGEVHYWAYASTSVSEARQRLRLIERCLTDLGVGYDRSGEEIVLREMPRGWRVFAATIGAVSGFRCFGRSGDELAKWTSADGAANPAAEVVASMTAMSVSHPGARALLISSPVGLDDYHARRFAIGDTADQLTCEAPTWIANPTISEEQTRRDEPDERIWSREYAAIPQAAKLAAFDAAAVARAFEPLADHGAQLGQRFGVIDASSGKKDAFTFAVCGWRMVGGARRLVVEHVDGFEDRFYETTGGERIVSAVARAMRDRGVVEVFGDQRESLMIASAFARHGLRFRELPWTAPTKERAVATVRRWLADGALVLPPHTKLRSELLSFEERTTPNGGFTFGARGSGHDDYVSLLITAAMVDAAHGQRGAAMIEALRAGLHRDRGDQTPTTSAPARRMTLSEALAELDRRTSGPTPRGSQITDATDFRQLLAMAHASRSR